MIDINVSLNGALLRSYSDDAFGNRNSMSEKGNTTIYSYDKRGNIAEKRKNDVLEKTFIYYATNMLTRVEDSSK